MPSSPTTLSGLLLQADQPTLYAALLTIATTIGLNTTTWQPGDPTRSLLYLESNQIAALEAEATGYIQSGFLDYATGQWLALAALEIFNETIPAATFATTSVTLTNSGGGIFTIAPGDLTFKSSVTGATYHNTSGGTLTGVGTSGATLSLTVTADLAGSASSANAGDISFIVTTLLNVTCTNPTAAVGLDAQDPSTTVSQCRNKLGSLSPNGPASGYEYIALNQNRTGIQTVTKAKIYPNSPTGSVQLYVAGPNSGVSPSDVAAVQLAINQWSTPLCFTPTVLSATPAGVNVTYTLWVYASVNQTAAQIQTAVQAALTSFFVARPIGGDVVGSEAFGAVYQSALESVIAGVYPTKTVEVSVSTPAIDGWLLVPGQPSTAVQKYRRTFTNGQLPVIGTVTPNVVIVPGR